MGAMVVINEDTRDDNLPTFTLVDGQQRLVTISVLLCALADTCDKDSRLYSEIRRYLVNFNRDEDYCYKVLPTEHYGDRVAWTSLISSGYLSVTDSDSRINKAYAYYQRIIASELEHKRIDAKKLFNTVLNKLSLVVITMNRNERPHQIFESLNAKAVELSLADLVRNYIAMRLPETKQNDIFKEHWLPVEKLLDDRQFTGHLRLGELSAFLHHYLACFSCELGNKDTAYADFRSRMQSKFPTEAECIEEIKAMQRYARYYNSLLRPECEKNVDIQHQLQRINYLGHTTTYPLLMYLYDKYTSEEINKHTYLEILQLIENYLVRLFLGNESTRNLGRLFPRLIHSEVNICNPESLKSVLLDKNYPSNKRIHEVLQFTDIYSSKNQQQLKFILSETNRKYANSADYEAPDYKDLTIEHIMPRKLNKTWEEDLGKNSQEIHENYKDRLGNLTLVTQKLNSRMQNKAFDEKRLEILKSDLPINLYFNQIHKLNNEEDFKKRTKRLVDKALQIWKPLGRSKPIVDYTRKKPRGFKLRGKEYEIKDWKELIYEFTERVAVPMANFSRIALQMEDNIRRERGDKKHERMLTNGWWMDAVMSANAAVAYIDELAEVVGLAKDEYEILLR